MLPTLAERFNNLFAGLQRAHGWYVVPPDAKADENGKVTGMRATSPEPVTLSLWEQHLAGTRGLGIIPAREDGMLRFAAIDIDVYPLDLQALVADVQRRKLPLICCRTKSGGAHLYFFTQEPLDAATVRDNMKAYASLLGYDGVEVFPKQDRIESEQDIGNWINMPYFGGARSMRYALAPDGSAMSIDEFLAAAETMQPLVALQGYREEQNPYDDTIHLDDDPPFDDEPAPQVPAQRGKDPFGGAPPCLITLANRGFPAGTRNNALFNLGVYAKKARSDGWEELVYAFNQRLMVPPLEDEEVRNIVKSLKRKRYFYKCKDHPIAQVCEKKICLTREHGVGGGAAPDQAGIEFGDLTKVLTKPVVWLWEIDGVVIEFETADLMNQQAFQARLMEALSVWPPTIKASMWRGLVQARMEKATEISPPDDAIIDGQLWEQLTRFCTSRVVGYSLDELLLGKPYTDETNGRTYFVATDFLQFLSTHRFPSRMNERLLYVSLRARDLQHHSIPLKGVRVSCWSVPAFKEQLEDHDVPEKEPEGAM